MRIGVDIGGTYTDCALVGAGGQVWSGKALTSADPVDGVLASVETAAHQAGRTLTEVLGMAEAFVHGTTLGTNSVLQRTGAATGLLTSRGHEDTLEIGRLTNKRAGLPERDIAHVSQLLRPEPLVPRHRIIGLNERVDRDGDVLVPLRDEETAAAVRLLVERERIEALAISFLWSCTRPDHELRAKAIALEVCPALFVSVGSELAPVIGEYERTVTAVVNAYIGVAVDSYLGRLEQVLRGMGFSRALLVMDASGGTVPASFARRRPIVSLDSGPVGGVSGATSLARIAGASDVICTDVGGTSFDVSIVTAGQPAVTDTPVIDKQTYQMTKVEVVSVGAGGGSIAHVDTAGILHVGPSSAGSEPGPACYARGGELPTVTDADVLLGYLGDKTPLAGGVILDRSAAIRSYSSLAAALRCSTTEAASSVVRIANANMADLIRKHTVDKGRDPRDFVIYVYGGAGAVHGAYYGAELSARSVVFVRNAGVFSALGMAISDIHFTRAKSLFLRTPVTDEVRSRIVQSYAELEQELFAQALDCELDPEHFVTRRMMTARFVGQVNDLECVLADEDLMSGDALCARFVESYEASYGTGTAMTSAGMEIVTLRVDGSLALGERPQLVLDGLDQAGDSHDALKGTRPLYDLQSGSFIEANIYAGEKLQVGMTVDGPAVIERETDTIVVPRDCSLKVDGLSNMVLRYDHRGEGRA